MSRINLRGRAWFMLGIYAGLGFVLLYQVVFHIVAGQ